ncbi:MAG: branched-chain amino acid ABC transporter permease [Alphaproteobacteria bacterium]|nr:branched-chain amino acid ABC transporter permease [Alphaproteobacteria bacterium]
MFLEIFLQQVANGLVNGMGYVLVAVGLTLVFGVLRIVNFAHGEFYMLGAYVLFFVITLAGIPYVPAVLLTTAIVAGVGVAASELLFKPLRREHEFTILMVSLGLSLMLANGGELLFGADPKSIPSPYADMTVELGPVFLTWQRIIVIVAAGALIGLVYLFIRFTRMGKMMQATAQNREGAALTGINIDWVHTYTFALACGLAAVSGALLGPTATILPTVGEWAVLKAFIVVVMGGLGSMGGAVVGGLLLGVAEALGANYISIAFKDAIGYAIIVAVLLWRPAGLFAGKR